ncbi:MAG: YdcF family protein [Thermaceae bacterium]|nr:YdcF family protein [Thermaceae bacterium]
MRWLTVLIALGILSLLALPSTLSLVQKHFQPPTLSLARAQPSYPVKAQWIVVLGAAQFNGHPSIILRNRLEAALRLYQQGKAAHIATTGGYGLGDAYSEGGVGCRYLESRGVPKSALYCEQKSRTTWENLENLGPVVGKSPIIIVTDEPHLPRALIFAERLGLQASGYPVQGQFKESYRQRESLLTFLARLGFK